ncbi:ubiquitinyl hydrolase 1 [Cystobasidiomycetes sp. EMM_F5]
MSNINPAEMHDEPEARSKIRWWTGALGLKSEDGTFVDVYGLDDDLLAFVPRPVYAILMLFPVTERYEETRKARDAELKDHTDLDHLLFFKQTIGNACGKLDNQQDLLSRVHPLNYVYLGTMGILHAVANCPVPKEPGTALHRIFADCANLTPAARSRYLETCRELEAAHTSAASGGQSNNPGNEDLAEEHFSAFVAAKVNGQDRLVELDGRRPKPVDHGPLEGGLLEATVKVVKEYIRISDSINFSLIALVKPAADD